MAFIFQMKRDTDRFYIRDLFWEYLQWVNAKMKEEFDVNLEIKGILEEDMAGLQQYAAPKGRLLMAQEDNPVVGIACLRESEEGIAEIKRMYVRPEYRGKGIGRELLQQLIDEARQLGYERIRLDSAPFMKAAHHLFQSVGFNEIDPYPQSDTPMEFHENWIFMEMPLDSL